MGGDGAPARATGPRSAMRSAPRRHGRCQHLRFGFASTLLLLLLQLWRGSIFESLMSEQGRGRGEVFVETLLHRSGSVASARANALQRESVTTRGATKTSKTPSKG